MSMRTLTGLWPLRLSNKLRKKLEDTEYRHTYVSEHVKTWIARQIRVLREQRDWSQIKLAQESGKPQSAISRLENPDYGQMSVQTLLDLASAFDVALEVRFVDHASFLRRYRNLSTEAMEVESFDNASLSTSYSPEFKTNMIGTSQAIEHWGKSDQMTEQQLSWILEDHQPHGFSDTNNPRFPQRKYRTHASSRPRLRAH